MEFEIRTDLPTRIKVGRKRGKDSDPQKVGLSPDGGTAQPVKARQEMEILGSGSASLVELEVLRVPPNPRLVICRYWIFGEERRCLVRVGRNTNFRRGMKLVAKRPAAGAGAEPWAYDGLLPRRTGRW
jgi:hypothetical protein